VHRSTWCQRCSTLDQDLDSSSTRVCLLGLELQQTWGKSRLSAKTLNKDTQHSYHCNGWMMRAAARLVCGLSPRNHVTSVLRSLHWLQLSRWSNSSSACLSTRPSMDEHPPTSRIWMKRWRCYLAELRTALPAQMTLRTRLKLGEPAFSVAAPRIWNQLPIDIKAATDTQAIKRKLKTHFFSAAYLQ